MKNPSEIFDYLVESKDIEKIMKENEFLKNKNR